MAVKVAINGFGRIGRLAFRLMFESDDFEIVALNDLTGAEDLAYLLKYDSAQGPYKTDTISWKEGAIVVDGKEIKVFAEKDPTNLPWKELEVDVVMECTGAFRTKEKAEAHIVAGAKKVIISAPAKGKDVKTVVYNVNHTDLDGTETVISAASCTTNCLAPVAKVLDDNFGIVKGYMTTVHAYTNDQMIHDRRHKDMRRARAATENIIPTTTGAAKAVALVLPELKGKLNGFALRVPVPTVSLVDVVFEVGRNTTAEEVNKFLKEASENELKGIMGFSEEPLVSRDFIGDERSSIVDADSTMVIDNMVKVVAWYDNEWGYSARVVDLAKLIAAKW